MEDDYAEQHSRKRLSATAASPGHHPHQQKRVGEEITAHMSDTLRLLSRSIETITSTFKANRHDR